MNKRTFILASALLVLCGTGAFAQKQSNNGGISAEMLTEIRKGYEGTASDKAVRNALNAAAINVLAANSENIAMIDTHFSDEVKTKGAHQPEILRPLLAVHRSQCAQIQDDRQI